MSTTQELSDFREHARTVIRERIVPLFAEAELSGTFPRAAFAALGAAGLVRQRWQGGPGGDPVRSVILAEELARSGAGGVAIGCTLAMEPIVAALRRHGGNPQLDDILEQVLDGRQLGCIAASEPTGGSDLSGVRTTARREGGGWRIRGEKKFVSLGPVADFALVLARTATEEHPAPPQLGLFCVPASGMRVIKPLRRLGLSSLSTAWIGIDASVPATALLGRPGLGLVVATHALTFERFAAAAQLAGLSLRAIELATAHLHRRTQFGRPLLEHQALRLRLADLAARLTVLRHGVYGAAAGAPGTPALGAREIAAFKVTAARFAEEVVGECMHMFGGMGYLEDETPLARMYRDVRMARLGGGSDEVMWELVAGGLTPDFAAYDADVAVTP
ncbi:acyl-CoA dehydrogenase [Micromonospora sp. KC207]|uniref:acyl-CoA dehydrogenase family protein n=1 Tax=Micromonospora sp. KC207 TaxID=2530377 RepID=UPI00104C0080|nr:acyl-CoA dehydrogenase family protein [Micromonospora sp. KC207]TDC65364.1 acyl-CoA dehydrogenase [Micromonospora sp. KC207]